MLTSLTRVVGLSSGEATRQTAGTSPPRFSPPCTSPLPTHMTLFPPFLRVSLWETVETAGTSIRRSLQTAGTSPAPLGPDFSPANFFLQHFLLAVAIPSFLLPFLGRLL